MEQHFSEHFPSWCAESENLQVTVFSGQVIIHNKKLKITKTHKKKGKKNGERSARKDRLFTKSACV